MQGDQRDDAQQRQWMPWFEVESPTARFPVHRSNAAEMEAVAVRSRVGIGQMTTKEHCCSRQSRVRRARHGYGSLPRAIPRAKRFYSYRDAFNAAALQGEGGIPVRLSYYELALRMSEGGALWIDL